MKLLFGRLCFEFSNCARVNEGGSKSKQTTVNTPGKRLGPTICGDTESAFLCKQGLLR